MVLVAAVVVASCSSGGSSTSSGETVGMASADSITNCAKPCCCCGCPSFVVFSFLIRVTVALTGWIGTIRGWSCARSALL